MSWKLSSGRPDYVPDPKQPEKNLDPFVMNKPRAWLYRIPLVFNSLDSLKGADPFLIHSLKHLFFSGAGQGCRLTQPLWSLAQLISRQIMVSIFWI